MSTVYTIQSCCDGLNFTIQNLPELVYVGQTYYITEIAGLSDGCYTVVSEESTSMIIYDASGAVIIYGITDCSDIGCPECPTPTPTPTPSITPTEVDYSLVSPLFFSPFSLGGECDVDIILTGVTPSSTTTPTPTPTPTSTPPFVVSGFTGFKICNGAFVCGDVKRIQRCSDSGYYYISEPIIFDGEVLTGNTTFVGIVNNGQSECLTYVDDISGTATDLLNSVVSVVVGDCTSCSFTQTPTPTPTQTPTTTPTPTPTPTSSQPVNIKYVYTACTTPNRMVIQTLPVPGVSVGQAFSSSGTCWTYVTSVQNYVAPGGFLVVNNTGNYFGTITNITTNCVSCLAPPPSSSPTFRSWSGSWDWTISCTPCYLTSGGVNITLYTQPSVTTLTDGVVLYNNSSLTSTFAPGRYFRYGQKIYEVTGGGVIVFICNAGGTC
jgi:hypothetical protein